MSDDDDCRNCWFFDLKGGAVGLCRRHAPRADVQISASAERPTAGFEAISAWPIVRPDDWCGDHIRAFDPVRGAPCA